MKLTIPTYLILLATTVGASITATFSGGYRPPGGSFIPLSFLLEEDVQFMVTAPISGSGIGLVISDAYQSPGETAAISSAFWSGSLNIDGNGVPGLAHRFGFITLGPTTPSWNSVTNQDIYLFFGFSQFLDISEGTLITVRAGDATHLGVTYPSGFVAPTRSSPYDAFLIDGLGNRVGVLSVVPESSTVAMVCLTAFVSTRIRKRPDDSNRMGSQPAC